MCQDPEYLQKREFEENIEQILNDAVEERNIQTAKYQIRAMVAESVMRMLSRPTGSICVRFLNRSYAIIYVRRIGSRIISM